MAIGFIVAIGFSIWFFIIKPQRDEKDNEEYLRTGKEKKKEKTEPWFNPNL